MRKKPEEWCKETGITIHDPDGWDKSYNFDQEWDTPITWEEFRYRAMLSTVTDPRSALW